METWRDALRQQVLQIGTGERKAGTKTGAADAVVLACVEHNLDNAEGAVVLVTSDGGLRAACRAQCGDALVANGVGQLLPQLNKFEPAEEDLALRAEEQLPVFLNEEIADRGQAMAFNDLGVEFKSGNMRLAIDTSPRLSAVLLSNVEIAEIHDFRIARDDRNRYGLADLRIFGDISIVVVEQLEIAPVQSAPVPEVVPMSMAHIDVTVAIRWNHNWQIEGIEPTGAAVVVPAFDDEDASELEVPDFRAKAMRFPGQGEGRGNQ